MFTRVVHVQTKAGKGRELSTILNEKVLTLLKKQPGFVDEITLISHNDPDRMLALSFWDSEQSAQRYTQELFPKISEIVKPFLQTDPQIETFHVDNSTTHGISKGKAA